MSSGSHYTVLARRFRPQAFEEVVGQDHIARALRNAIRQDRVAHAYLFTGARGVGKTSTARILAKALNCPHVQDGVPCNQCEICEGISAGNDVDVLEIDGASNRGIDDIRSLRANVGVRSMRTRYKVYIIDEVHMLTREAFNALLKTLEEPPPGVKFVFCTTEPNKVPDTILSRCQRFDFSAIDETSITGRLREIAIAEGYEVSDEALELVARRARGSMRDSQSLFDQLLAFSEGTVSAEDVHRMLGTAADEQLIQLFDAAIGRRPGEVLNVLDASLSAGVQCGELTEQAVGYVRDLMVTLAGGSSVMLSSVSARSRDVLQQQASQMGMPTIMAAFQILVEARNQMFRSTFARTILEMAMIQISVLENLSAISDLLSGRLPAIGAPVTDAAAVTASAGEPEKKNDNSDAGGRGPLIEFADANLAELLTQTGRRCGLNVTSALRSVAEAAIGAAGQLCLTVSGGASGARRVLEERRQEIEDAFRHLTGKAVSLDLHTQPETESPLDDVTAQPTEKATPPPLAKPPAGQVQPPVGERQFVKKTPGPGAGASENLLDQVNLQADRFVQQVSELFGGKIVRVTVAPDLTRRDDDDSAAEELSD